MWSAFQIFSSYPTDYIGIYTKIFHILGYYLVRKGCFLGIALIFREYQELMNMFITTSIFLYNSILRKRSVLETWFSDNIGHSSGQKNSAVAFPPLMNPTSRTTFHSSLSLTLGGCDTPFFIDMELQWKSGQYMMCTLISFLMYFTHIFLYVHLPFLNLRRFQLLLLCRFSSSLIIKLF